MKKKQAQKKQMIIEITYTDVRKQVKNTTKKTRQNFPHSKTKTDTENQTETETEVSNG